ncbi:MAG TPA: hypothetical protein VGQ29_04710 [Gemmatimonadales bacterium]|nr:hypothetical protein [Gemmatimonadales bacterium]
MRPLLSGLCLLAACTATHHMVIVRTSDPNSPAAAAALPPVRSADSGRAREMVRRGIVGPLQSLFNSPGMARRLAGRRTEAYNVTSTDDVSDAAWIVSHVDAAAVGPDTSTPWTVVGWRRAGTLPVLTIRDAAAREYWLTFDAPEFPEVATTAAIVAARLYWATGYHVPTVSLVRFDPEHQLAAAPDSLRRALEQLPRDAGHRDRIRAAAHYLAGRPVGVFSFSGRRRDDPADSIPHEQRRELRGLYVVAAWLNHTGLFRGTTLDVVVDGERATPAVRHYLLGLETTLDAAGGGVPKKLRAGAEATWDPGKIVGRTLTLGFFAVPWERSAAAPFDPGRWTPDVQNPAFAHRTTRDGFWGAKRVGAISNAEIEAAVRDAALSDSTHAQAVIAMLEARRTATLRYWYGRVTPLDGLSLRRSSQGPTLDFQDLAVVAGLTSAGTRSYEMRASWAVTSSDTLTLSSEGRGTLRLPPWTGCMRQAGAQQAIEKRIGWIDISTDSPHAHALRLFVLCAGEPAEYRLVGWRY